MENLEPTIQEQMISKLKKLSNIVGLGYEDIKCYGSQLTIQCKSLNTCRNWASYVGKFSKIYGITKGIAYNKVNKKTQLNPSCHKVYTLFCNIGGR